MSLNREVEASGKPGGAEDPGRIVNKALIMQDTQVPMKNILVAIVGVYQFAKGRRRKADRHGIDCEIAPEQILGDCRADLHGR